MSDKPDIDKSFDRLLSAFLRDELSAAERECPSPGVLAAYYEKRLDPSESEPTEAHVAGCRVCQEQLAALVRIDAAPSATETSPPVPVERVEPVAPTGERRRWRWEWIAAPFAVAATAVIALTIAHRNRPELETASPRHAAHEERGIPAGKSAAGARSDEIERSTPPSEPTTNETGEKKSEEAIGGASAAKPEVGRLSTDHGVAAAEPRAEAPSALAMTAEPASAAKTVSPRPKADAAAFARSGGSAEASAPGTGEKAAVVFAARSDPRITWRLRGGSIERSDDGGASWRVQATDVASGLLAGSAPNGEVSWVSGNHGVVLRTTDGEHWRRVESPTEGDLVEIVARSATTASVKDASGHRFSTHDGGRTWSGP